MGESDDFVHREFTNRWNGEKYMDYGPSKEALARWRARITEIERDPNFESNPALYREWEQLTYLMDQ